MSQPKPPASTAAAEPPRRPALRPLTLAAVGILLVLLAVAGVKSYRDLEAMQRERAMLQDKVDATRHRIDALKHRVERLRDDPATLERLAREELGMVRPGDVVIVLPADDDAAPAEPENPSVAEAPVATPAAAAAAPAATEPAAVAESSRSAPQG